MFDDQMIYASKDSRIVNLFTLGSHHRNLSVIGRFYARDVKVV